MRKTIDIGGRSYNISRNAGYTHMEAITDCVVDVVTALEKAGCFWVTNVATDGEFITISASPGMSSHLFCRVLPLNETDNQVYCYLRKTGLSEAEVRDKFLNDIEAEANDFCNPIKTWHIAYVPGYAIILASS